MAQWALVDQISPIAQGLLIIQRSDWPVRQSGTISG